MLAMQSGPSGLVISRMRRVAVDATETRVRVVLSGKEILAFVVLCGIGESFRLGFESVLERSRSAPVVVQVRANKITLRLFQRKSNAGCPVE